MKAHMLALAAATGGLMTTGVLAKDLQPKISMATARSHALTYVPHGKIASAELETEHGQLIYSFDIKAPNHPGVEEVQISAMTGKLVSRKHETPAAESREKRMEAKEHK